MTASRLETSPNTPIVIWNVGKWPIPFYQTLLSVTRAITVRTKDKMQVFVTLLLRGASVISPTATTATQSQIRPRATVIRVAVAVVLQIALVVRGGGAVSPVVTEAHLAPAEADTGRPTSPTRATRPTTTTKTSPSRSTLRVKTLRIFTGDRCRASYSRSNYCSTTNQPFQPGPRCFY